MALYGATLGVDSDPASSTDDFVDGFIDDHGDALGVDDALLIRTGKVNIANDKYTVYTYVQMLPQDPPEEPITVHGSVLKIPVFPGATEEKITYVTMHLLPPPVTPLPPDLISDTDAVLIVANSPDYEHLTTFTDPERVVFEADGATGE